MNTSIEQRVREAIAEEFELDIDTITPEARLAEDLGLDSLDGVDLIACLERSFSVKCPEVEARKLRTVGEIFAFIERLQAA